MSGSVQRENCLVRKKSEKGKEEARNAFASLKGSSSIGLSRRREGVVTKSNKVREVGRIKARRERRGARGR